MADSVKTLSVMTAVVGALAVAGGAFGAHSLSNILDANQMDIFNKGVHYQMLHVLAALAVIILYKQSQQKRLRSILIIFLLGILCFSGSLYLIVYLLHFNLAIPVPIAFITPLGGLLLISGWLTLGFHFLRDISTGK